MPELPDLTVYLEALAPRVLRQPLEALRIVAPFVLRTVTPRPDQVAGCTVTGLTRIGKQLVLAFEGDRFAVIHLMIAGRLRWRPPGGKLGGRQTLAEFRFPTGALFLTEAGTRRRAALHLVEGRDALAPFDRGGLEVMTAPVEDFVERLLLENHTLKRALTDPRLFAAIGNAYSDEILHRARLSPLLPTSRLDRDQSERLYHAARATLAEWTDRLRREAGGAFPERVTAFRDGMAVHGRHGQPCPVCGSPVQRIRYAENETNYCAGCQTGGRLLADRALSRLLRQDWPRTLDDT